MPRLSLRASLAIAGSLLLAACGAGGEAPAGEDPPACLALPSEVSWLRSETASADWNDLALDAHSRLWLAGYIDGQLGQSRFEPDGDSRALVRQLATDGTLLWDSGARFDTPGTDVAEALAFDATGTVAVAGRTTGAFAGAGNAGQFDTFLAWAPGPGADWRFFQTGNERPQHPRRLRIAPGGDFHLAGYDDEYVPSNYIDAWSDPFALALRRVDVDTPAERLAPRWLHQFDTAVPDLVDGLAVDAQGATYLSGVVQSGERRGIFVRKLDAQGQPLWTARYTQQAVDHISALVARPDGSLWMAGSVYGSFHGGVAQGGQDVFVARISGADGHVIARFQYGSAGTDWLTDLAVDAEGRLVLFGETDGSMVPGQDPAGLADLFLVKLAEDGRVLARRQWGTAADEQARRVVVDRCGRVAAVGSSTQAGRRAGLLWFWAP